MVGPECVYLVITNGSGARVSKRELASFPSLSTEVITLSRS